MSRRVVPLARLVSVFADNSIPFEVSREKPIEKEGE